MNSLKQRLGRLMPYFRDSRPPMVLAGVALVVAAATEPAIPALLKILTDKGFKPGAFPIWAIPLAIVTLFIIRGAAGWIANYGLTKGSQNAVLAMRAGMFAHMLRARPAAVQRQFRQQPDQQPGLRDPAGRQPADGLGQHPRAGHPHRHRPARLPDLPGLAAHAVHHRAVPDHRAAGAHRQQAPAQADHRRPGRHRRPRLRRRGERARLAHRAPARRGRRRRRSASTPVRA